MLMQIEHCENCKAVIIIDGRGKQLTGCKHRNVENPAEVKPIPKGLMKGLRKKRRAKQKVIPEQAYAEQPYKIYGFAGDL